jgi:hypothetical protein
LSHVFHHPSIVDIFQALWLHDQSCYLLQ